MSIFLFSGSFSLSWFFFELPFHHVFPGVEAGASLFVV